MYYKRLNRVWAILGGRTVIRPAVSTRGSVRVQVYFAHTPKGGGKIIEFGLWDTTIPQGQEICFVYRKF
jgi:hypothetical protein